MTPRGLLAVVCCAIWSAAVATALPSSTTDHTSSHGTFVKHSEPDPLWHIYGLNRSEEFKYFHEPGRDDTLGHYDSRFFRGEPVPEEERSVTLTHMIRAYLNFFEDNALETWIAHGTLLGWWWNGKVGGRGGVLPWVFWPFTHIPQIMPWDWDIDTQVMDTTLFHLADHFNQTVVQYTTANPQTERKYLLDVNPWARQRDRGMGLNIIDARWIDISTGLYIDITGLSRLNPNKPTRWECKNGHEYQTDDIYPLRTSTFEGVTAKVPFRYDGVLTEEYTKKALTNTQFHDHTWNPKLEEWVLDEPAAKDGKDDRHTLTDLTTLLSDTLHIPPANQKLLIAPKPGMLKHPFAPTPLSTLLPLTSPKFKLTLLGTPTSDIDTLNAQATALKTQAEARLQAWRTYGASPTRSSSSSSSFSTTNKIHTLSSSSTSSNSDTYTFHRLLPLPHLPHPERSLTFLTRLRSDPGIRSAMAKHKFSVPLLTEMDPIEHTTMESRTLGLNRNKGEVIELRLRTDAYDGYRDYRTIRKTLCHELAHCVFSDHDRDFWDLTAQIEREVERGDYTKSGRTVGQEEFYNPRDWEGVESGEVVVDERGWTGGSLFWGVRWWWWWWWWWAGEG
ncbi:WLM-domain-containing protein [Aspergillus heteromorphus CBS 117.55]|uniref:WLM-domain-containing protein n=1 Tax=Aspergillus heteromorphus CBS 117.55 TaxID=1448321 RepID=A0A317VSY6_9EURO|nr:WLM-domain-containing protein [Aspergillus heteromorphus CBS 117.55]PWY77443.1 WLM-domain-containing protein [Aspergillus heteromorphus CBS 117.55]